ncbi:ribonuclease III [Alphaproteobacteria bacterium GH1-50]|uniref:Ribonuclease 3 n=1 Tax=Kangsaoukella pontilimi TaxID=2691042 RepID=A0A7C9IH88_9RHOB|nr:ribonuclease III [Kangsaoukella pontilimi]MXQ08549.1 ribonuclease III [Kangsaoukella pontilimi]
MKPGRELDAFQSRLGHRFRSPELLIEAVTHPSVGTAVRPNNQRLEFLGDRVLNLIVAEALLEADPTASEGVLAPRYNMLVRKETCAEMADEIGLGAVLRLSPGEMKTGGRRRVATLADAFEAVIAAIYLDAGYGAAKAVLLKIIGDRAATVAEDAKDPKSALQEWAQGRGEAPPDYVEIARKGPPHAPVFTIEARLADGRAARAEGTVKREVEKAAAKALLGQVTQPR